MKPDMIIGLTGCTGAGKTTALEALKSLGAFAVDCDAVYHSMLQSDGELLSELRKKYPEAFSDGKLDRKALGKLVFGSEEKLRELTDMTQRHVARKVRKMIASSQAKTAVIDGIGLIESGLAADCTVTVAVTAPAEIRAQRIMARENISREYAMMRIRAQKDGQWFADRCDLELINDCETYQQFYNKARELFNELLMENRRGKERTFLSAQERV